MKILSLLALLAIPTVAYCDVLRVEFRETRPPIEPAAYSGRLEVLYGPAETSAGQLYWDHGASNWGSNSCDVQVTGTVDPANGSWDLTFDSWSGFVVGGGFACPDPADQIATVQITPALAVTTFGGNGGGPPAGTVSEIRLEIVSADFLPIGQGDANENGVFDSSDLVQVFQAGEYEDSWPPGNSTWATGDWTMDREFTTSDLVAGFQAGYSATAVAIPEPSSLALLAIGGLMAGVRSRRRWRVTLPRATARQQPPLMPLALIPLNIAGSPKNCLTQ